jgi:hypothetical protein
MTLFGALAYLIAVLTAPWELKKRLLWTVPLLAAAYGLGALLVSPIINRLANDAPPEHAIRIPEINSIDLLSFIVPQSYARFGGQQFASLSEKFPVLPQNDTAYLGIVLVGILVWFTIQFRKQWWALMLISFTLLVAILSMGPRLHIAGTMYGYLPGQLLQQLPLIKHATSDRFPIYLSLAVAVIVAIWVAAANGRALLLRLGAASVGVVLLSVNLAIEPTYHGTLAVPAFFSDGTYQQYVPPGTVIFGIPYQLGGDLTWQVATDFDFKLARGYIGPIHPVGHNKVGLGVIVTEPGKRLPGYNAVRFFIRARQVVAVVAEDPVPPEIVTMMHEVLAVDPISTGGVTVWVVPPQGPTKNAPVSEEPIFTTPP